jgi:hypothetical protein
VENHIPNDSAMHAGIPNDWRNNPEEFNQIEFAKAGYLALFV